MPRETQVRVKTDIVEGTVEVQVTGHASLTLDLAKVSQANRIHAEFHGWEQRLRDAAAIPFNAEEKRYATPEEKHAAIKALVEHYASGAAEWQLKARGPSEGGLLFRALTRAYPERSAEALKGFIAELKPAQRRTLLDSERLSGIVKELRALGAPAVDTDQLFSALEEME